MQDDSTEDGRQSFIMNKLEKALEHECLTPFARKIVIHFLQKELQRADGFARFERIISYIVNMMNPSHSRDRSLIHPQQLGCPELLSKLRAIPVWDTKLFPWIEAVERGYHAIREEFLRAKDGPIKVFQPYRSPPPATTNSHNSPACGKDGVDDLGALATSQGSWNVCYLQLHDIDFSENAELFPHTRSILRVIPRNYEHSFISALAPATHISPHHGPTNKKLRCQLPLILPPVEEGTCWLRVADEKIVLVEGKCLLFDDSFEHEAMNSSSSPRIVLIFDTWHPDLSDEEVRLLKYISHQRHIALHRMTQHTSEKMEVGEVENFYDIINAGRHAQDRVSVEDVWGR